VHSNLSKGSVPPSTHQTFITKEENGIVYLCNQCYNKNVSKHTTCHQAGSQTNSA